MIDVAVEYQVSTKGNACEVDGFVQDLVDQRVVCDKQSIQWHLHRTWNISLFSRSPFAIMIGDTEVRHSQASYIPPSPSLHDPLTPRPVVGDRAVPSKPKLIQICHGTPFETTI